MKPIHILCLCLALGACSRAANAGRVPDMTPPRETEEFIAMTNPELDLIPDSARP